MKSLGTKSWCHLKAEALPIACLPNVIVMNFASRDDRKKSTAIHDGYEVKATRDIFVGETVNKLTDILLLLDWTPVIGNSVSSFLFSSINRMDSSSSARRNVHGVLEGRS